MKVLLKNLGLFIILIGAIVLSIAVLSKQQTNTHLLISIILIIAGLLTHILINKYSE